jgi:LemA protein
MVKEAFSGVDVQLKRRYDLVPNLVNVVKEYSNYEKNLFENIANIRSEAITSASVQERSNYENQFTSSLKNVLAIVEKYPEIKANVNFLELQKSLVGIEDQLQLARRYYNGSVRDYNILIESFPKNIVASIFKYKKEDFFEVEFVTQRENPEVNLNNEVR